MYVPFLFNCVQYSPFSLHKQRQRKPKHWGINQRISYQIPLQLDCNSVAGILWWGNLQSFSSDLSNPRQERDCLFLSRLSCNIHKHSFSMQSMANVTWCFVVQDAAVVYWLNERGHFGCAPWVRPVFELLSTSPEKNRRTSVRCSTDDASCVDLRWTPPAILKLFSWYFLRCELSV